MSYDVRNIVEEVMSGKGLQALKTEVQKLTKDFSGGYLAEQGAETLKQAEARYRLLRKSLTGVQKELDKEIRKTMISIRKSMIQIEKSLTAVKSKAVSEIKTKSKARRKKVVVRKKAKTTSKKSAS